MCILKKNGVRNYPNQLDFAFIRFAYIQMQRRIKLAYYTYRIQHWWLFHAFWFSNITEKKKMDQYWMRFTKNNRMERITGLDWNLRSRLWCVVTKWATKIYKESLPVQKNHEIRSVIYSNTEWDVYILYERMALVSVLVQYQRTNNVSFCGEKIVISHNSNYIFFVGVKQWSDKQQFDLLLPNGKSTYSLINTFLPGSNIRNIVMKLQQENMNVPTI